MMLIDSMKLVLISTLSSIEIIFVNPFVSLRGGGGGGKYVIKIAKKRFKVYSVLFATTLAS